MSRASTRRAVAAGAVAGILAFVGAPGAAADPFARWTGDAGPYSWEAKRLSCGVADGKRSRVRAHSRWRTAPGNGYQRVTFKRQIRGDEAGSWTTVQRQRWSTKNSPLEGARGTIHWKQWFRPFPEEAGKTSRHSVVFQWLRDRPGADRVRFRRAVTLRRCVVGG